jgi:hypothetical protein
LALPAAPADCEAESTPVATPISNKNRCLPNGLPAPKKTAARAPGGATCVDHRSAERRLAPLLSGRFRPVTGGTVSVSFDCDPVVGRLTDVIIERGFGHGGSLNVWHLTRRDDDVFDVLAVAHDSWYVAVAGDPAQLLIARGTLATRDLERALATARPALTAQVRELEPPPKPGTIHLHSMFSSSGNFHHFIAVRDDRGHELSRSFTDYPSSDRQRDSVSMVLAMEQLTPLLEPLEFARGSADDALKAWFSGHVLEAWPRVKTSSAWWVRERFVNLGAKAGTAAMVPLIVEQLERGLSEVASAPTKRAAELGDRYLTEPLAALTAITGWDPRTGLIQSERIPEAAAREAIAECRRGM